jgi:DNA-binding NtrC family response regulator
MTGYTHLLSPSQAFALGAVDYIMKPFDPEVLIGSLERVQIR